LCELKATLNGQRLMEDVVYAKEDGGKVVLRDVLGLTRVMEGCRIIEVDVTSEKLVLGKPQ